MKLQLDKGDEIEIYTPYGGGITLWLSVGYDGLRVACNGSRLKIKETRKPYMRDWTLSREDEGGYDRT